ncbi:MAG: ThuA domain-containing protein [Phycisphaerales bacterium]|nr:ThuA domain-containing protein [Phycisphaerales bacterium]MCB9835515.1 ThuA domain-containing protein [Phycisphaera sp.]
MKLSHILAAVVITLPVLAWSPAPKRADEPTHRVLVFSKTAGFRHGSIPDGVEAMRKIGESRGWSVDATEDSGVFTETGLAEYDAVVFLSTTGDVLDGAQQEAFEKFIHSGKGYMGIHAAADTEYDWPWYASLVGAQFKSHPSIQEATIHVLDQHHPSTKHLGAHWVRTDEWYDYRSMPADEVSKLLALDETTYEGATMGDSHPIAWCHEYDGGRSFYTGGGHTSESFTEPDFVRHLEGGLAWVLGEED